MRKPHRRYSSRRHGSDIRATPGIEALFLQIDCCRLLIIRKSSKSQRSHRKQSVKYGIGSPWDENNLIDAEVPPSQENIGGGRFLNMHSLFYETSTRLRGVTQREPPFLHKVPSKQHHAVRTWIDQDAH